MSKITLTCFALLLLLFLGNSSENYAAQSKLNTSDAPTGTFQKMIVENGSVTMNLDLDRFNAIGSVPARTTILGFAAAANSFFTILVFNDLLRSPEPGSMALALQNSSPAGVNAAGYSLPAALSASIKQLVLRNFLQTRLLTSLCATAKRALPFSTSKDINTTTILTHNP